MIAIDSSESNVESSKKRLNALKRKTTIFSTSNQNTNNKQENESQKQELCDENFQTFSQFIQSTTQLNNLIDEQSKITSNENNSYALIGLHTCGNLSNSIINLYLNKNCSISHKEYGNKNSISPKLLCNIACCYDSLDEKYSLENESLNTLEDSKIKIDNGSKFPMSNYLNSIKYYLNFNTRRSACHSLASSLSDLERYKEVI